MKKSFVYSIIIVVIIGAGGAYFKFRNSSALSLNNFTRTQSPQITGGIAANNIGFKNYGEAPEFSGIEKWLNGNPQSMEALKGRVVLVNFWSYSCINCIKGLPQLNKLYATYKDQGLTVIGVHTPQFAFERVTENVQNAINRYQISYSVAIDNKYSTWSAFNNQFWPAQYLVDKEGKIVYSHFGEGNDDVTENAIRQLIGLPGGVAAGEGPNKNLVKVKSPEMFFGLDKLQFFGSNEQASDQEQIYTLPASLKANMFAVEGTWKFSKDKAALIQGYGRIKLNFNSGKAFIAASSIKPVTIKVTVDGVAQPDITVQTQQNYNLFDSTNYKAHTVEIEIPQPGFEAYSFTFS